MREVKKLVERLRDKYKIPYDEVETTQKNLKHYEEELEKYLKEGV